MKEKKKQQYYRIFYDNFQRSFYSIISETLVTIFYFFSIYFILYTDDRINRDGQFSFSPFTFSSPFFFFSTSYALFVRTREFLHVSSETINFLNLRSPLCHRTFSTFSTV